MSLEQPLKWPYLQVLYKPKAVIESRLYLDPERGALVLVMIFGFAYGLLLAQGRSGAFDSFVLSVAISAPLALVHVLIWVYAWSYLMHFCALILNLPVEARDFRLVMAFSYIPLSIFILLNSFGSALTLMTEESNAEPLFGFSVNSLISLSIASLWSLIIYFSGLRVIASSWIKLIWLIAAPAFIVAMCFVLGHLLFLIFERQ